MSEKRNFAKEIEDSLAKLDQLYAEKVTVINQCKVDIKHIADERIALSRALSGYRGYPQSNAGRKSRGRQPQASDEIALRLMQDFAEGQDTFTAQAIADYLVAAGHVQSHSTARGVVQRNLLRNPDVFTKLSYAKWCLISKFPALAS